MPQHTALHRSALAATILAALAGVATPASAQFGGLVNRAKDKLVREAVDKSVVNASHEGDVVAFNDVIIELTPAVLDKVITGLRASRTQLNDPSGRQALMAKRDAAANEAADLMNRHGREIDAANERRWKAEACHRDAFKALDKGRDEALAQRAMADAAFRDKVMALTMKAAEVQASGDSSAMQALQNEMRALRGESRADTVAVERKCGTVPALHPADARIKALQADQARYDQQIRDGEQAAAAEEARASGLPARQFAMARERIEMYLARARGNSKQRGFTTAELEALNARRADLQQAM